MVPMPRFLLSNEQSLTDQNSQLESNLHVNSWGENKGLHALLHVGVHQPTRCLDMSQLSKGQVVECCSQWAHKHGSASLLDASTCLVSRGPFECRLKLRKARWSHHCRVWSLTCRAPSRPPHLDRDKHGLLGAHPPFPRPPGNPCETVPWTSLHPAARPLAAPPPCTAPLQSTRQHL